MGEQKHRIMAPGEAPRNGEARPDELSPEVVDLPDGAEQMETATGPRRITLQEAEAAIAERDQLLREKSGKLVALLNELERVGLELVFHREEINGEHHRGQFAIIPRRKQRQ